MLSASIKARVPPKRGNLGQFASSMSFDSEATACLRNNYKLIRPGAQTMRPGDVAPVRILLGGRP